MSLTRKMLEELGIEEKAIERIITGHAETVEALKKERDLALAEAEKVPSLQKELEEEKAKNGQSEDWKAKYESEHEAFETFKTETAKKASDVEKADLYRKLLVANGVDQKRVDAIMKVTDLGEVTVKDGKLEDAEKLAEGIKSDWADFITTTSRQGLNIETPPSSSGGTVTKDSILKMTDPVERQKAIAENISLFREE